MKKDNRIFISALLILSFTSMVTSCGGGGGSISSPVAPFISAELDSFPTGSVPPGLVPSGFNSVATVYVIDDNSGDPITNAAVSINGVTLTYDATNQDYEGNLAVVPGGSVTLSVEVSGILYEASGSQFTAYPTIMEPTTGATWHSAYGSYIVWAGPNSANIFYGLGVVDATDPNGPLIWPSYGYLANVWGAHAYTIPANSLTVGNRILLVGIAKEIPIPNAAAGSVFDISGFSSAPVSVSDAALASITVEPSNASIIKGSTQQYKATGTFTDNNKQNLTSQVAWSSWSPTVATMDSTGLATGVTVGSTVIIARVGTISVSTPISIMPGTINSITITPVKGWIGKGKTQQYSATGLFSDNSTRDITTQVTWTSSDEAKVTIDTKGLATGSGIGLANITATLLGASSSTPVKLVAGFNDAVNYPAATINNHSVWYSNTTIGDLNGDGRNDVAVLEDNGLRIFVYYQNSGGTLDPPVIITTDIKLQNIAIADINNDGLSELIVSGNTTTSAGWLGRVGIFSQDHVTHVLGAPQEFILSTNNVVSMTVADLNGDGKLDLVVSGSGTNGVLSFLFQQSDGTLGSEVTNTSFPVNNSISDMHVADMDNNGLNDIVLQTDQQPFAVIKQTSQGVFNTSPEYYIPQSNGNYWHSPFALGDVNGDGLTDLIIANDFDRFLSIFLQNSDGKLSGPTLITTPYIEPNEVHIADLDGDGLNDIVIFTAGHRVSILYQYPDHSFSDIFGYYLPVTITGGTTLFQMLSVGDVTGDGPLDIVSAWTIDGLYVLRQRQ